MILVHSVLPTDPVASRLDPCSVRLVSSLCLLRFIDSAEGLRGDRWLWIQAPPALALGCGLPRYGDRMPKNVIITYSGVDGACAAALVDRKSVV
jgi:hypothetical protein